MGTLPESPPPPAVHKRFMSGTTLFAAANSAARHGTLPELLTHALDDCNADSDRGPSDRRGPDSEPESPRAESESVAAASPPGRAVALLVDTSSVVYSAFNSRALRRAMPVRSVYLLAHACKPETIAALNELYVPRGARSP